MILLVESDPDLRSVLFQLLEILGYQVLVAPNSEMAIHTYLQYSAQIDGIIVASNMPGMTGLELIETVRSYGNHLPAVLLSVFDANQRVLPQGDVGFLSVPCSADMIKRKLDVYFKPTGHDLKLAAVI